MDHTTGHVPPQPHRIREGPDGEIVSHPYTGGIANDLVATDIFDRTRVKLALLSSVFGDIGQPQLIRPLGHEPKSDPATIIHIGTQIILDRRAGLLPVLDFLLPEHGPSLILRGDLSRRTITHFQPGFTSGTGKETVTVFGVLQVGVVQGMGTVRFF